MHSKAERSSVVCLIACYRASAVRESLRLSCAVARDSNTARILHSGCTKPQVSSKWLRVWMARVGEQHEYEISDGLMKPAHGKKRENKMIHISIIDLFRVHVCCLEKRAVAKSVGRSHLLTAGTPATYALAPIHLFWSSHFAHL